MRRISMVAAPFLSFGSQALYRDVGRRWRAGAFVYLLLLLALVWLPSMMQLYFQWMNFLAHDAPAFFAQIPQIQIVDGRVTADVEQPHYIRDPDSDEVFAIIDTTGQVSSLGEFEEVVLLTEDRLVLKRSNRETRVYDLSAVAEFSVDGPTVEGWAIMLGTWGVLALYPAAVVVSYLYRLVQALIFSALGILFARQLRSRLDFAGILRVTLVALTPAILVKTAVQIVGVQTWLTWLLYPALAGGYMIFGLAANRSPLPDSRVPSDVSAPGISPPEG